MLVEHADIEANDDALCLKSGRDSDGLRVNRPTEDVVIRDSIIRDGAAAFTFGSETSGGFRNIEVYNITALSHVPSGVLFKSAHTRGGIAQDIRIHDLTLEGVAVPIHMTMNWNPSFSYATLPRRREGFSFLLGHAYNPGSRAAGTASLQRCSHLEHQGHGRKARLRCERLSQRDSG